MDFHQTFVNIASWDIDELGSEGQVQGHSMTSCGKNTIFGLAVGGSITI